MKDKLTAAEFLESLSKKKGPANWSKTLYKLEQEGRIKKSKTKGRPKLLIQYAKFVFYGVSFNWNTVVSKAKRSAFAYAKYKAEQQKNIVLQCENLPVIDFPGKYKYTIYTKTRRADGGNLQGVSKVIEDALQEAGIIENDNRDYVSCHEFYYKTSKEPRVELEIIGI